MHQSLHHIASLYTRIVVPREVLAFSLTHMISLQSLWLLRVCFERPVGPLLR